MVELRSQPQNPLAEQLSLYARGGPQPSERTVLLLRRYALPTGLTADLEATITALLQIHEAEPTAESAYALAELNYVAAARAELLSPQKARDHYVNAVAQAYAYLFDPRLDSARNPYDPQFRGACVLYNTALEKCLRIAQHEGSFIPGTSFSFESCGRVIDLSIVSRGFSWRADDFASFRFVSDFDLKGLTNQHRTRGLGVPLIAVRRSGVQQPEIEQYYAKGFSFPVTAFLRLDSSAVTSRDPHAPRRIQAVLELYDPLEVQAIQFGDRSVPLESDISTPLAYFLDNPAMRNLDTFGLLRPGQARSVSGLYMVQPYQPGKIPVLLVHGLWSSPMTWMEALNDLRSDPVLRENFQFWFYLYPSGQPFWQSAADLREDLAEVQRTFGPRDQGHSLDRMVVIGHSMGGLIARLISYDSGEEYWSAVSRTPLAMVNASDETKAELRRLYYFESNPLVRRVVTIGSPHRGSDYANSLTQFLARRLIELPKAALDTTTQLLTLNPNAFRDGFPLGGTTSIDSLSPQSPILQAMHATPRPEGVVYHSVIGATKEGVPLEENTDGVVAVSSAHMEDVASEIVVAADHSALHRHPRTILELRRILREHLAAAERERNPIQLLDHVAPAAPAPQPPAVQPPAVQPPAPQILELPPPARPDEFLMPIPPGAN
jgi:pimeloyl-ACP methyl ester carboxylesterase